MILLKKVNFKCNKFCYWSNSNAFVSGAGGQKSNLRPVKLDTLLPTVRHRCDFSSNGAVLPWRKDAEMDPAYFLHDSA